LKPGERFVLYDGEHPDVAFVADQAPGVRTGAVRVEVAPGGNRVLSHLDVAAPDGAARAAIAAALAAGQDEGRRTTAFTFVHEGVAVRFSDNRGSAADAGEYAALCAAALALYDRPEPPAWAALQPVTIDVQHADEAWTFQLAKADEARVRPLLGAGSVIARVSVPFEVADEFRRVHGALYPHAAEWVTGLTREQLLSLGGVRVVDAGKAVWEWPRR
jgi:hypothetical protein